MSDLVPIPQPIEYTNTIKTIDLLKEFKCVRKPYQPQTNCRVNKKISNHRVTNERKLISELISKYFHDISEQTKEDIFKYYDKYCFIVATHAWTKSNTRMGYILCCFLFTFKKWKLVNKNIYPLMRVYNLKIRQVIIYQRLFNYQIKSMGSLIQLYKKMNFMQHEYFYTFIPKKRNEVHWLY